MLQVTLEAAGVNVEGERTREMPKSPQSGDDCVETSMWREIRNCAIPSAGNYTINLKINSKEDRSEKITPISTVTHDTTVTNRFTQALYPILLAVVPVTISAIVTLATKGI